MESEKLIMKILYNFTKPKPYVIVTVEELSNLGLKIGSTTEYTNGMMQIVTEKAKEAVISTAEVTSAIKKVTAQSLSEKDVSVDEEDSIYSNNITSINLSKSSAKVEGNGAKVEGTVITISEAGTYTISGDIEDGQIVVDASDDDKIKIVLNGVNIKNSKSSAIYIKNADKTIISLKDGTNNYIEDGQVYEEINSEDNEPNAAIFSKDDLIISGSGSLEVKSNYKDGITSKDDLIIAGGDINIESGSGSKNAPEKSDKDFGMNFKDNVMNNDKDQSSSDSKKGLKSELSVEINGGNLNIDSYDDAINSGNEVIIASGSSGMLQAPSSSSTQHVINAVFSNSLQAGTSINIKSETGENILTFTPNKEYQSIILCSPDVKKGETYTISAGGIASGESKDGLYTNSTFSNSTESINCTVSDIITNAGSQNDNIRNGDWKHRK